MDLQDKIDQGKRLFDELAAIISDLPDYEAGELLRSGALDALVKAILDPRKVRDYKNIAEFFLANRNRAHVIALLHYTISQNYSIQGEKEGQSGFVSPSYIQWFDDGVMLLEGQERFAGILALYRDDKATYAISARDALSGEKLGPEHFIFVDEEEVKELESISPEELARLDEPQQKFRSLLDARENDEAKYQKLLRDFPWMLGAQHKKVQRHTKLDDKNIPDFTGVRIHDDCRDIFEVKPPFTRIFLSDGKTLSNEFNKAWNQAGKYLDFVREQKHYLLQQKGLRFENPVCYLIIGYNLSGEQVKELRRQERLTPSIKVLTYDDLLAFVGHTVEFIKKLRIDNVGENAISASQTSSQ